VTADDYLRRILQREAVDAGADSPLRQLEGELRQLCQPWGGRYLLDLYPTGAFEKGTANRSGTAIDFLASLAPHTPYPVDEIYHTLLAALRQAGLEPVPRGVAVGFGFRGLNVDLIPGKRESLASDMHTLYRPRLRQPVKTNLTDHVLDCVAGGRCEEIRILKLWRDQAGLAFPSFYLELAVTAALRNRPLGQLAGNVWTVLGYLEGPFMGRSLLDPVNVLTVVSDDLTLLERAEIKTAAHAARTGKSWQEIVH
jgi:hypothetical protein